MSQPNSWQVYKTRLCKYGPSCTRIASCCFFHSDTDRRRPPKQGYKGILCLEAIALGSCSEEKCKYCNNYVEFLYHPDNYKHTRCIYERRSLKCERGTLCPFYHSPEEYEAFSTLRYQPEEPPVNELASETSEADDERSESRGTETPTPVSPPGQYILGFRTPLFEDLHTEFKNVKRFLTPAVVEVVLPYLSAYLNAEGGTLYYGIENNGIITGVKLTRELRDSFSLALDNAAHSFHPQLTHDDYKLEFKPVYKQTGAPLSSVYVIELTVNPGKRDEIYLTNKNKAYIKRDASIYALSPKDMLALYRRKIGGK
mmetsp:Transcript_20121/g.37406  ORF Transcript_20121/g.37406 Transcript_20121/m.37406 type:complete len:313 (-) Transcript_20121:574-1512(-)|eukprot:CAMPEP_0204900230 /NCGR_PEP_ID=MMETSP1397-20131031/2342_1 /ASSEMBLY_ACC=CAM_ASM_000891 /TAXON_ID=49980 /ORGANISM="Climacostomum Climacostomum virens, Strain Stock W-24" /LENGTH=312 /DNA_ID=CAMNT_0052068335 /DNA_START=107 /DNA_END=1045 /DNA_ORIENTATION=+